jgi:hypothetical protein
LFQGANLLTQFCAMLRHRLEPSIAVPHLAAELLLFVPETLEGLLALGESCLALRKGLFKCGPRLFEGLDLPSKIIALALDLAQLFALLGMFTLKSRQSILDLMQGCLYASELAFLTGEFLLQFARAAEKEQRCQQ